MVSSAAITIRLALPKGQMLSKTAEFLNAIGLGFENYNSKTRIYRMQSQTMPSLRAKMLNEKDIPVQVAIGNYDFGICTSDWLQELQVRYPASHLYKIADLEYDRSSIFMACSKNATISAKDIASCNITWRIATEYPALAESTAYQMRLRKFRIFPLWGSAEAYPPENADFAVMRISNEETLHDMGLRSIRKICDSNACIVANTNSLQSGDFSPILPYLTSSIKVKPKLWQLETVSKPLIASDLKVRISNRNIWLALADGHQQIHTSTFLKKTGIKIDGYSKDNLQRRPSCSLDWVNIKVIRPQDMPQQVANGNFDLAITGRDWLLDHLYQFPSSPATELVNLNFGWVRVVAVVSENVPADSIDSIKELICNGRMTPLRIASEYVNIADKYLRDNHVARYRVIPTWGATEVYLPEDADMLIENTETGQTIARHKLKIIDTLFESTACLIGNRQSLEVPYKNEKINKIVKIFREAASKK